MRTAWFSDGIKFKEAVAWQGSVSPKDQAQNLHHGTKSRLHNTYSYANNPTINGLYSTSQAL